MQAALIDIQIVSKRIAVLQEVFPGVAVHSGEPVLASMHFRRAGNDCVSP